MTPDTAFILAVGLLLVPAWTLWVVRRYRRDRVEREQNKGNDYEN